MTDNKIPFRSRISQRLFKVVAILLLIRFIVDDGMVQGVGRFLIWLVVAGCLYALYRIFKKDTATFFGVMLVLCGLFTWFWYSNTLPGLVWRDLAPDIISLVATYFIVLAIFKTFKVADNSMIKLLVAWVGFGWIVMSTVDWLRPHSLPLDHTREVLPSKITAPWPKETRVGVALSGGGYRAALYHSGVLSALEDMGVPISTLSTVSGGSIVGAYYYLGGDPRAFPKYIAEGRFSLKRELLKFPTALALAFPFTFPLTDVELFPLVDINRVDVQTLLLRRLLSDGKPMSDGPSLVINTSDLTFGAQVAFIDNDILFKPSAYVDLFLEEDDLTLEPALDFFDQVAISGAFPVAFPTTVVDISFNAFWRQPHPFKRTLNLVDGGVIDNHGIATLLSLNVARRGARLGPTRLRQKQDYYCSDLIIGSDASAIVGQQDSSSTLPSLVRSFDVPAIYSKRDVAEQIDLKYPGFGLCNPKQSNEDKPAIVRITPKTHYFNLFEKLTSSEDSTNPIDPSDLTRTVDPDFSITQLPDAVLEMVLRELGLGDRPELSDHLAAWRSISHADKVKFRESLNFMVSVLNQDKEVVRFNDCVQAATKNAMRPPPCEAVKEFLRQHGVDVGEDLECNNPIQIPSRDLSPSYCSVLPIEAAISRRLSGHLNTFMNARTLKDHYRQDDANSIYTLGRLMTFQRYAAILSDNAEN